MTNTCQGPRHKNLVEPLQTDRLSQTERKTTMHRQAKRPGNRAGAPLQTTGKKITVGNLNRPIKRHSNQKTCKQSKQRQTTKGRSTPPTRTPEDGKEPKEAQACRTSRPYLLNGICWPNTRSGHAVRCHPQNVKQVRPCRPASLSITVWARCLPSCN